MIFLLFIDLKTLSLNSSNDYRFEGIFKLLIPKLILLNRVNYKQSVVILILFYFTVQKENNIYVNVPLVGLFKKVNILNITIFCIYKVCIILYFIVFFLQIIK